jgi:response regulator RpfG family c-di-GMP phosphodiesterase
MEKKTINVLYVDDLRHNLEGFKANFRRHYTVFTAISALEARKILSENTIHILITDQKMPETLGTQLLEEAIKQYPEQMRILLTAYTETEAILEAYRRGLIYHYLFKPYRPEELKEIIDKAYEIYTLKRTKEHLYKEWIKTQEELELLKVKN